MKLLLFFVAMGLRASTVFIDSNALSTTNDSGHATVDVTPNPSWAPALAGSFWVSYGSTGAHNAPGYFSPPNGTDVTFTTQFVLTGLITGGGLRVLADDSASVVLNGHVIIAAQTITGQTCAAHPIGCVVSTEGVFSFAQLAPYLVDGTNTLKFGVVQLAHSSFGLDFAGSVETSPTPEAGSLGLLAMGLIGITSLRRRLIC